MELKAPIKYLLFFCINCILIGVNGVPINENQPSTDDTQYRPIPKQRLTHEQMVLSNDYLIGSNIPEDGKPFCSSNLCTRIRSNSPIESSTSLPNLSIDEQILRANQDNTKLQPIDEQHNIYQNVIPISNNHNINIPESQNNFEHFEQTPQVPEGNIEQKISQQDIIKDTVESSPNYIKNVESAYQYPINQQRQPISFDGIITTPTTYQYGPGYPYDTYDVENQRLENMIRYYQQQIYEILHNLHKMQVAFQQYPIESETYVRVNRDAKTDIPKSTNSFQSIISTDSA